MFWIWWVLCTVSCLVKGLEIANLTKAMKYLMDNNDIKVNTIVLCPLTDLSIEVFIETLMPTEKFISSEIGKDHQNGQLTISLDPSDISQELNNSNTIYFHVYLNKTLDLNYKMYERLTFDSLVFIYQDEKLYEIYKMSEIILSEIKIEEPKSIWERRKNLQNYTVNAVYAENVPYVFTKDGSEPLGINSAHISYNAYRLHLPTISFNF